MTDRIYIDEIKTRLKITDVAGLKAGMNKCLFHDDNNPSLSVWGDGMFWKCHACNIGGDVFDFLSMRMYNQIINGDAKRFKDVLKHIEDTHPSILSKVNDAMSVEENRVYAILQECAEYWYTQLGYTLIDGKSVSQMQRERGLTDETITQFKIGYADPESTIVKSLLSKGYLKHELVSTGCFYYDTGEVKCLFQGRIMYPYFVKGVVVYFIGRQTSLTPKNEYEVGKYKKQKVHKDNISLVSPCVRNDYFFGEDSLTTSYVFIPEGVVDAITLLQYGEPCISPVTTHFPKQTYSKLLQLTQHLDEVYIIFDNEEKQTGFNAAQELGHYLVEKGVSDVRLCTIPKRSGTGKIDVNDYLKGISDEEAKRRIRMLKQEAVRIPARSASNLSKSVFSEEREEMQDTSSEKELEEDDPEGYSIAELLENIDNGWTLLDNFNSIVCFKSLRITHKEPKAYFKNGKFNGQKYYGFRGTVFVNGDDIWSHSPDIEILFSIPRFFGNFLQSLKNQSIPLNAKDQYVHLFIVRPKLLVAEFITKQEADARIELLRQHRMLQLLQKIPDLENYVAALCKKKKKDKNGKPTDTVLKRYYDEIKKEEQKH